MTLRKIKVASTKSCPECGTTKLVRLSSLNKKIYNDCKIELEWLLEEDQQPLCANNRVKNKEEH